MSTLFAGSTGLKEVIANSLSGGGGTTADTVVATTKNQTQDFVSNVQETTQDVVSNVKETTQDAVSNVKDTTQDALSNVKETTQDAVSNVKDTTQDAVSNVKETTQDSVSNVVNQTQDAVSNVKETTQDAVSNVVIQTQDAVSNVKETTQDAVSNVKYTTQDALSNVKEATQDAVSNVKETTQDTVSNVKDTTQDAVSNVVNQTDGFVSTAKDTTQGFISNVANQKEDPDTDTDTATTEEEIPVLVVVTSTVDPTTVNDDNTGTMMGGLKETLSEGVDTVVDKTQTVLGGVTDLFQDVTASVSISFDNATTVAWDPYGNSSTTEDDAASSTEDVFGQCGDVLFGDDAYAGPAYFPVFVNTRPILSAHDQIWRGGHTNDILQLLIGSADEKVDYLTGVVVSAVTILVIFLAWMITLITLSCYGSHRVGFWSGRRRPLPPRLRRTTRSTTNESAAGTPVVVTDDTKGNDDGPSSADNALADEGGEGNTTNTNSSHLATSSGTKDDSSSSLPTQLGSSRTTGAASLVQNDRKGTIIDRLTRRFRKQHSNCDEKTTVPPGLPDKEWEALYATKKKEEMYMKGIVLFACVIVICMAGVMANKGIGRLIDSLRDGKETIGYANDLIIGGNSYVTDLASGIESFRVDVLDLLNQTNTKLCPRLKPEGLCPRLMEIDSCDFTIQVDFDRNTTNGREIDVDQNVTVDISDLTDAIKSKVGLNGTIDLTSLLFPNAPEVYKEMVELFSSNWTIVDEIYGFSDRINSISTIASRTEEQVGNLEWVFYIAVGFDVFVGILVLCMIVHILVGRNLPASVRCIQRRFLFPVFIFCVSLAFIFAIAFLVASLVISDTCVDGPGEKILQTAEFYLRDYIGFGADIVMDLLTYWLSQCDEGPRSMEADNEFLKQAELFLQELNDAIINVTDDVSEFCGTSDPDLFANIIGTNLKYICGVIGLLLDVGKVFQCNTWMPLYYNTVHNAMCYNGQDGIWSIVATQLTAVLMACIILTFRAVFFELEIPENDDRDEDDAVLDVPLPVVDGDEFGKEKVDAKITAEQGETAE